MLHVHVHGETFIEKQFSFPTFLRFLGPYDCYVLLSIYYFIFVQIYLFKRPWDSHGLVFMTTDFTGALVGFGKPFFQTADVTFTQCS